MKRITSENDLNEIKKNVENSRNYQKEVFVCGGTGCLSSGAGEIVENLEKRISEMGKQDEIRVIKTGCFGFCEKGPI